MPKKPDENKIRVYPLLDPGHYLHNREMLAELLFPDININREQKFFSVSSAGFISYSDYAELWKENVGERRLPKNGAEAEKAAKDFITQAYFRFKDKNKQELKKNLVAFPFPAFEPVFETVSVMHQKEPGIDHWLCRYSTDLYWNDGTERIPVYGALIEMRVGDKNKIIGLNIRYRPVTSSGFSTTLLPHEHDKEDEEEETNHEEPTLVYVLETDNQKFLAPYYLTMEGHHLGFLPASEYSIVADILQENTSTGANLYPLIGGMSNAKNIAVSWAYWKPDKVMEDGIINLGANSTNTSLAPGVYNMILDVQDQRTQQVKRFQKMVYIMGQQPEVEEQPPQQSLPA